MVKLELSVVDLAEILLRVLQYLSIKFLKYIQVLQFIQVLQYMLFRDLQYIESLLGYVTFRCYQILGFSEITNFLQL